MMPAIVTTPVLAELEFAATVIRTTPLLVPLAPEVMVKNPELVLAVHAHPAAALTVTLRALVPLTPAAGTVALVLSRPKLQLAPVLLPHHMSANMPSMIGPGVWMASAVLMLGVISELMFPAG